MSDKENSIENIGGMKQHDNILDEAYSIIYGDREKVYGNPSKNIALIARYWSSHLDVDISVSDVCVMMMLLKIARIKNDPDYRDNWTDTIGYAALHDRCKTIKEDNE